MSTRVKGKIIPVILIVVLCLGSICTQDVKVLAASAAMNLALSEENILVDNTFSVVLTIESSEDIGDVETFLSFDRAMLQFVSGGAFTSEGEGMVLISDKDSGESGLRKKYSIKFKAIKGGETTIGISKNPLVYCALDGVQMSVSNNQLIFEIVDPERISDDAQLDELTIFPGKLSPEFKNTIHKYTAEVDNKEEKIAVHTKPSDDKATVSIKGNTKLKVGENKVKITVTAPSGAKETVTIVVTRKEAEITGGAEGTGEDGSIDGVEVKNIPPAGVYATEDDFGNRFLAETIEVKILPLEDDTLLPQDYEKTTIVMDGLPITVYCWKYNLDSDILLVYGENQDGIVGFYQYNRLYKTLKPYNGVAQEDNIPVTSEVEENAREDGYKRQILQMGILTAVFGTACIGLTIGLVFQIIRKREEKEEDFF